jgi:hypothetical protein
VTEKTKPPRDAKPHELWDRFAADTLDGVPESSPLRPLIQSGFVGGAIMMHDWMMSIVTDPQSTAETDLLEYLRMARELREFGLSTVNEGRSRLPESAR